MFYKKDLTEPGWVLRCDGLTPLQRAALLYFIDCIDHTGVASRDYWINNCDVHNCMLFRGVTFWASTSLYTHLVSEGSVVNYKNCNLITLQDVFFNDSNPADLTEYCYIYDDNLNTFRMLSKSEYDSIQPDVKNIICMVQPDPIQIGTNYD